MTQMQQGKIIVVAQKMSQMKIPLRRYPYYWNRSQNFARFKMPDGTTVILQGKNFEIESILLKILILLRKIFLKIDLNKQTLNFSNS
jgi:hypothetical protein